MKNLRRYYGKKITGYFLRLIGFALILIIASPIVNSELLENIKQIQDLHNIKFENKKNSIDGFYNNQIRSPAEFETVDQLIITWPKWNANLDGGYSQEPYYIEMVKNSEDSVTVNIITNNNRVKNRVISKLKTNNIPLTNVTFTILFTNSIWVRDYGPFFIEESGKLKIVDFHYYQKVFFYRPIDDLFPTLYGLKYGIDFNFISNFLTTLQGGNYISDGNGIGFVADRIFEHDNPHLTEEKTKNRIKQFLGLEKLIVLKSEVIKVSLGGDETGHIDMYAKLLDYNTMLVAKWNEKTDVNYQILEDNANTLKNLGYDVIRIPILRNPENDKEIWTYTNSLIINGTKKDIVLVPQYNTSEDQIAISIYEEVMSGYEIRGINCESIISYYGAIHCTTMTVPLFDK